MLIDHSCLCTFRCNQAGHHKCIAILKSKTARLRPVTRLLCVFSLNIFIEQMLSSTCSTFALTSEVRKRRYICRMTSVSKHQQKKERESKIDSRLSLFFFVHILFFLYRCTCANAWRMSASASASLQNNRPSLIGKKLHLRSFDKN